MSITMMKSMIMRMRMQRIVMEEWNAFFWPVPGVYLNQTQASYLLI